MNRHVSGAIGRSLVLLLCVLTGGACSSADSPPPNVVLYLVDTLRQDHLSLYGAERQTTPELDELAKESVVFENAYASSAWTKASTASLLSGLYPQQHGAVSRSSLISQDVRLIGDYLAELGYYRAAVITNAFVVEHWGFDRGYDLFRDMGGEARARDGWQLTTAERVHRNAFRILDERTQPGPFFLYVHTIDVHGPNDPPAPYDTLFTDTPEPNGFPGRLRPGDPEELIQHTRDLYDSEIRYADACFGEFLDGLRARGLYDNTLIWFVSDHGEEFLDHGRGGHGMQLFDEVVKVPMVLKLPRGEFAGRVLDAPVSLIDVLPTMLNLLGLEVPADLPGEDLMPLIRSGQAPERPLYMDLDLTTGRDQVVHLSHGLRLGRHKYFEEILPEPQRYLFDVVADPTERTNLLESEPELAQSLASMLRAHRAASRSGLVLRAVGDKAEGGRVLEVSLRAEGQIQAVDAFDLEAEDSVLHEAGSDRMTLRFVLRPYQDNAGSQSYLQDMDSICLRLDPPNAALHVESIQLAGEPLDFPILKGPNRAPLAPPAALSGADPELELRDLGLMFSEAERNRSDMAADELRVVPGLYSVSIPGPEAVQADVPEDIWERLRGLGYVE